MTSKVEALLRGRTALPTQERKSSGGVERDAVNGRSDALNERTKAVQVGGRTDSVPYWHLLACPACRGALTAVSAGAVCSACGARFLPNEETVQLDFRLREEKSYTKTYAIGGHAAPPAGTVVEELAPHPAPAIAGWCDVRIPSELTYGNRLTPQLLSYFPRAEEPERWMLDLGCGSDPPRRFFEALTGFGYLGVDHAGTNADLLVDAHSLPLQSESFDFIVSIAVLEHLEVPDVAMSEAFRVLKPGGVFVGTGAFLEPFHFDSHAHMTHLGIYRTLHDAGFEVVTIAPNREWSGLRALAEMSLFPIAAVPRWVKRAAVAPIEAAHRGAWRFKRVVRKAERASELRRLLETTAGFRFVARRPT